MKKLTVINLLGGPGIGKSTQAADVFSILKKKGYNCELITEYAKDMTWQESFKVMTNQLYVFAKQHQKLFRVNGKVDIAITDSPLITSLFYMNEENKPLKDLILLEYNKYKNFTFLLKRETEYQQQGRYQDLNGAIEVDKKVLDVLNSNNIEYQELSLEGAAEKIVEIFELSLKKNINEDDTISSSLRNKLSPVNNLVEILLNCDLNEHKEIILSEARLIKDNQEQIELLINKIREY